MLHGIFFIKGGVPYFLKIVEMRHFQAVQYQVSVLSLCKNRFGV